MSDPAEAAVLVDAHVHIYDCFDIETLLDAALINFGRAAQKLGLGRKFSMVLLLAETSRDNWFLQMRETCLKNQRPLLKSHWQIDKTPDKTVLQARRLTEVAGNEKTILIMAGRQIITVEGLELLALATDSKFEDGLSLADALSAVREQDAIPVLPWAVGKWLGKRGKLLSALLQKETQSDLCLGDNSGRPVFWQHPTHFQQAQATNIPLLPGTDPLPFASEASRVGNFGFMMQAELTTAQPSTDIKRCLRDKSTKLTPYGQLETPLRFVVNQIRLRLAN